MIFETIDKRGCFQILIFKIKSIGLEMIEFQTGVNLST